ncbi:MAG: sugar kinase [Candidatus Competibacterales bacterium]
MVKTDNLARRLLVVVDHTELQRLTRRYATRRQVDHYLQSRGHTLAAFEAEEALQQACVQAIYQRAPKALNVQLLQRDQLSAFAFRPGDIVATVGRDGLVANTLRWLDGQPLIGLNPDPATHDGVLCPFGPGDVEPLLARVLAEAYPFETITLLEARFDSGERLLAANDFFIGPREQSTLRYELHQGPRGEAQMSSGVVAATGLGSTAWYRSILQGARALVGGANPNPPGPAAPPRGGLWSASPSSR